MAKLKKVIFQQPLTVLQVFSHFNVFYKADKNNQPRQRTTISGSFNSDNIYITDKQLLIPEIFWEEVRLDKNLLVIHDCTAGNNYFNIPGQFWLSLAGKTPFHIFNCKKEENTISLLLYYNYFTCGTPERQNFMLADLVINQAAQIKINGKMDATLGHRKERTYIEQEFVIENSGTFQEALISPDNKTVSKKIPPISKSINLMKPLW